jgi:hypothetical protein
MLFRRKSTSGVCQSSRSGNQKRKKAGVLADRDRHGKSLRIEPLEDRHLLSASVGVDPYPVMPDQAASSETATCYPLIESAGATAGGYTPAQIRHAYGIDLISHGSIVGNGAGQTIAIVVAYNNPKLICSTDTTDFATSDLYAFDDADLKVYQSADAPTFLKLNQTGKVLDDTAVETDYPDEAPIPADPLHPADGESMWGGEAAMDVEWVHAIAPMANIILIEANTADSTDMMAAVETARNLESVSVVSMSFGWAEAGLTEEQQVTLNSTFTTPDGHSGITFVAATGDDGSPGLYPAFSSNVLAVGGTSLTLDATGTYVSETGWSGSGGGQSDHEDAPSYQEDVNTSGDRQTPDVSFVGDVTTGVAIYDSYDFPSTPGMVGGGTSLAAPCWAGLIAIANQIRADVSPARAPLDGVSETLPLLYKLPSTDFHDITSGSNGPYTAGVGYDMVTGRGTPLANLLVSELALTAPTVTINQHADLTRDPTNSDTIYFTVVFSERVTGFTKDDVVLDGTAGSLFVKDVTAVGTDGTTYTVAVKGMSNSGGTVIATIPAGVAQDELGNLNEASTSTDNQVIFDNVKPKVTVSQAPNQDDTTQDSPIRFRVVFDEDIGTSFTKSDVTVSGTANAKTVNVIPVAGTNNTTYTVEVSGMTGSGTVIVTLGQGAAQDRAGNFSDASTTGSTTDTDNKVNYTQGPTVTVQQASGQADPATDTSTINYTVTFGESVSDFGDAGDVVVTSSVGDELTWTVTGSGTTYNVAVKGMRHDGTVTVTVPAGVAHNSLGLANFASTTDKDNVVTYVTTPTVTINQKDGQLDPTDQLTLYYTVKFSEPVTDFVSSDVTITGTAPWMKDSEGKDIKDVTVTKVDDTTYTVAVKGMAGSGTVIARILANTVTDVAGHSNTGDSTSTDNSISYTTPLSAIVSLAESQTNPTGGLPIVVIVEFSEKVVDFTGDDVSVTGTALGEPAVTPSVVVTPLDAADGMIYKVEISGSFQSGTVIVGLGSGVVHDELKRPNGASNTVQVDYDVTRPTVTVNQAAGQKDPVKNGPIYFTVTFSEAVTGFATGDAVAILTPDDGSGPITLSATVTGSGTTYTVAVTGMTKNGTVTVTVPEGEATDGVGNTNLVSTSTDNSVKYDIVGPTVTINQAVTQIDPVYVTGAPDPANPKKIVFRVVFSEPVTDFGPSDLKLGGTAGATTAEVTQVDPDGKIFNVAVSGMTTDGTVIPQLLAGVAHDAAGNPNAASTSTDNQVYFNTTPTVTINQATDQADPASGSPVYFTVTFSEPVIGFTASDVVVTGTAFGNPAATPTVSVTQVDDAGAVYRVAVNGIKCSGTVIATIPADAAQDLAVTPNKNTASTSTDNAVYCDIVVPTVTIAAPESPTGTSPINFTVTFGQPVADFAAADVVVTGTAFGDPAVAATVNVTQVDGDGMIYKVAVSGMKTDGTVIVNIPAGVAHDAANNPNSAAAPAQVQYSTIPTVTINQAASQADPSPSGAVMFTVVLSEPVTDFTDARVASIIELSGPAAVGATPSIYAISSDRLTYTIKVSGVDHSGSLTAKIAAGKLHDAVGNVNTASTSTDNTVVCDVDAPSVLSITLPSSGSGESTVKFSVKFSEAVVDFAAGCIALSGTAEPSSVSVVATDDTKTLFDVTISGMAKEGTVIIEVLADKVHDAAGNACSPATSQAFDYIVRPTVTINQTADQSDPATGSSVSFTVVFSEPVTGFGNSASDVILSGTAGDNLTAQITPVAKNGTTVLKDGTNYTVVVTGMTRGGTVIATIPEGAANGENNHVSLASTSTDNTVNYKKYPTVTINQAASQVDPVAASETIRFTVTFDEPVTGFTKDDVVLSGTATWTDKKITVSPASGWNTTYDVTVSGMSGRGTVIASVVAGAAKNDVGDLSVASTSTDNSVDYYTDRTVTITSSSQNGAPLYFTVTFWAPVTDFSASDVIINGTAGATVVGTPELVAGTDSRTYKIAVSGMKADGTVVVTIPAGVVHDAAGRANPVATATANYRIAPVISLVAVGEAKAPKNGVLEADEALTLTWATTSKKKLAAQSVTIDGRRVAKISGPFSGIYYSASLGQLAAGTHTYVITATDSAGVSSRVTGTFKVNAIAGPVISKVVIAEAVQQNSIVETGESLKMTWSTTTSKGVSWQTVAIDGKQILRYAGPFGGQYYSCNIGQLSAGKHVYVIRAMDKRGVISVASGSFTVASPLRVAASQTPKATATSITDARLAPIVAEAMLRWESQLGTQVESTLAGVNFKVANLSSGLLAETAGKTVWIDNDAAGYGWFVDSTPADDAEFAGLVSATTLTARAGSAADQRADLLTAVMHEMGHLLGLEHVSDGLMNANLPLGVRRSA